MPRASSPRLGCGRSASSTTVTRRLLAALASLALLLVLSDPAFAEEQPGKLQGAAVDDPATFASLPARCQGRPGACRVLRYGRGRPVVVAWGDSHLAQLMLAVTAQVRRSRTSLTAFVVGGCGPHLSPGGSPCADQAAAALAHVEQLRRRGRAVTVLMGAHWSLYRTDARYRPRRATPALFRRLGEWGVRVHVVAQQPTVPGTPTCTPDSPTCDRHELLPAEAAGRAWLRRLVAPAGGSLLDINRYLCPAVLAGECYVSVNGRRLFPDGLHLDVALARRLASAFAGTFRG